jgi:hypothetical protein
MVSGRRPAGGLRAGLEGIGTPVLVPRLGQADFTCNACDQVCRTNASALLALDGYFLSVVWGGAITVSSDCSG